MTLAEMLEGLKVIREINPAGAQPAGIAYDSRKVKAGDLFVAIRGLAGDGLVHLPAALRAGASGAVVGKGRIQEASRLAAAPSGAQAPPLLIEVEDERKALALLSRNFHGKPDLDLRVCGVTGTNGKTTTAHLLAAILERDGSPCGLLGTVQYRLPGRSLDAVRTTPESADLYGYLREMADGGAGACVMEVSSHALELQRVHGLEFAAGIFTNLTRDHLDYHGEMESYYRAKRKLFDQIGGGGAAVINADDPFGRRLAGEIEGARILYGEGPGAEYRLARFEGDLSGSTVTLEAEGETRRIKTGLIGRINVPNILAAVAAARSCGAGWEAIAEASARFGAVRGRMERVEAGQPFTIIVDYAHTDDALRNALETLRPLTPGRLIVVFGAGGDKDKGKRAPMGGHAARLADRAWVTSDNPRGEDPMAIIGMVMEGASGVPGGAARCEAEPDRRRAIGLALDEARDGDTVLIAGKGHEPVQIVGTEIRPFDDAQVARDWIEKRSTS